MGCNDGKHLYLGELDIWTHCLFSLRPFKGLSITLEGFSVRLPLGILEWSWFNIRSNAFYAWHLRGWSLSWCELLPILVGLSVIIVLYCTRSTCSDFICIRCFTMFSSTIRFASSCTSLRLLCSHIQPPADWSNLVGTNEGNLGSALPYSSRQPQSQGRSVDC